MCISKGHIAVYKCIQLITGKTSSEKSIKFHDSCSFPILLKDKQNQRMNHYQDIISYEIYNVTKVKYTPKHR